MRVIPATMATHAATWYNRSDGGVIGAMTGAGAAGGGGIDGSGVSLIPAYCLRSAVSASGPFPRHSLKTGSPAPPKETPDS